MNLEINNKVIFITGSSRGIGNGIAKVLLNEGCKVIISGRSAKSLNDEKKNSIKYFQGKLFQW